MRARDIMSRLVDDGVMSIGDEFDATDRHVATAIAAHEEDDR